jgi:hypothetical protein
VFAFVDSKVGDWFCYDDGHHWAVMVITDAASRGPTRSEESHPDPAAREAELHAEHLSASGQRAAA